MLNALSWIIGKSIRRQLIIGVAMVHLVLMTIFVYDLTHRQKAFLTEKTNRETMFQTMLLATSSEEWLRSDDLVGLQEVMQAFSKDKSILYAMVIDPDGHVMSHTDQTKVGMYLQDSISVNLLKGPQTAVVLFSTDDNVETAVPIFANETLLGWARVAENLTENRLHIEYVNRQGILYTLAAILIGTLFAFGLSYSILRQLKLLLDGVERMGTSEFSIPIPIVMNNEVGVVSNAFNAAMEQIGKQNALIRDSEEKFRALYENSPVMYFTLDSNGTIQSISKLVTEHLGFKPKQLLGTSVLSLFVAEDVRRAKKIIDDCVQNIGTVMHGEFRKVHKNGSILMVNEVAYAMKDANNNIVILVVCNDMTERIRAEVEIQLLNKNLEQRIQQRTAQLESANRELEAFSYSVSHDLRSPLRAIDGFAQILSDDYSHLFDDEGKRLVTIIRDSTSRMDELISGLLDLSRSTRTELNFSRIEMASLAVSMYDEVVPEADRKNISFSVHPLPDVMGDAGLMKQVWTNLISNAVKYTSKSKERKIEIDSLQENGFTTYFVKDSGIGFNPEYQSKLFGVFQRLHTKEDFEGSGVGLAIVQRIIQRHGGKIWAEGKENEGATFYFSLPSMAE